MEKNDFKFKETTGAKIFKNIFYYPFIDFDIAFKINVLNKVFKVVNWETISINIEFFFNLNNYFYLLRFIYNIILIYLFLFYLSLYYFFI